MKTIIMKIIRRMAASGAGAADIRAAATGAAAPARASRKTRARAAATAAAALTIAAALLLSACTAPRAWDLNKTQTAHEKTQSSQLNGAGMSIGDAAVQLLESDYAAFSDAAAGAIAGSLGASEAAAPAAAAESYTDDESIPGQGTKAVPESEAVMEISGKYVSKQYMEFRAALYAAASSEPDPVKAAEDLIKKQTAEWTFAQEHGILPTDDEVAAYCESMRSDAESDIESREMMLVVVQNMSLNESEYFRVFLPRYEVPFILVTENISRYCAENGIDAPDASEAQVNIKDGQYIQELKEKYQKISK